MKPQLLISPILPSSEGPGPDDLPLISVIVPVYNTEAYLIRCLDSIIAQTCCNLEIIIINDGSSDRSPVIAEEYAKKDLRICLVHQENAGVSEARNAGMRLSHGSYLSFIDSDDFIEPDYYETLYRILYLNNADISICNMRLINHTAVRMFPCDIPEGVTLFPGSEALTELVNDKWLRNYLCDKLFKKDLFGGIEFPKDRTFEDMAIMHKIFYRAKTIVITNEIKYNYILRNNSLTSSMTICNQYHRFLSHIERVSFFKNVNRRDLALKEIIKALHSAMNATALTIFHFTTDQEKEYLSAIKTWTTPYKDKLNTLPYETASEAKTIKRFLTSHTFFMVRYASKYFYIRSKSFIKQLLPVKLIALFIMAKSVIEKLRGA
jgi:glycosyltransferase involved in cell wall biosynthesis